MQPSWLVSLGGRGSGCWGIYQGKRRGKSPFRQVHSLGLNGRSGSNPLSHINNSLRRRWV